MHYVQLLEVATITTGQWLTFWDLEEGRQISLELTAELDVEPGSLFRLDKDAQGSARVLDQIVPQDLPSGLTIPFDVPQWQVQTSPDEMHQSGIKVEERAVAHS